MCGLPENSLIVCGTSRSPVFVIFFNYYHCSTSVNDTVMRTVRFRVCVNFKLFLWCIVCDESGVYSLEMCGSLNFHSLFTTAVRRNGHNLGGPGGVVTVSRHPLAPFQTLLFYLTTKLN